MDNKYSKISFLIFVILCSVLCTIMPTDVSFVDHAKESERQTTEEEMEGIVVDVYEKLILGSTVYAADVEINGEIITYISSKKFTCKVGDVVSIEYEFSDCIIE